MTLAPAGARGYAAWQRIANYDGPIVWQANQNPGTTGQTSPVLDCSRYAYVGGQLGESSSQALWTFNWYADAGGVTQIASRQFVLYFRTEFAQIRLPNLGPFLKITIAPIPNGGTIASTGVIFFTNRVHPLEFIPTNPGLISQQATAINANTTNIYFPSDYYAGPVSVWASTNYATGLVDMDQMATDGTWQTVNQYKITTNGPVQQVMIAPAGAWRVAIQNSTASASTFYLAVTPSVTGAA